MVQMVIEHKSGEGGHTPVLSEVCTVADAFAPPPVAAQTVDASLLLLFTSLKTAVDTYFEQALRTRSCVLRIFL